MSRVSMSNRWGWLFASCMFGLMVVGFAGCSSGVDSACNDEPNANEITTLPEGQAAFNHSLVLLHKEPAIYPRLAEQAGLEGTVLLKLKVGTTGKVKDAEVYVTSGTPSLDEAALRAARRCLFIPAGNCRRVVPMWVLIKYEFALGN